VSVVVSDTSPLHYLILCDAEEILPRLFESVVLPPVVFQELQQPNTPERVRQWTNNLPSWIRVQKPTTLNPDLDVDAGELEAICLAQEIRAAAVLMDDRAGRIVAQSCGLAVVGTVGLLERASERGLVDFPSIIARLQQTNARLDAKLVSAALKRDQARKRTKE